MVAHSSDPGSEGTPSAEIIDRQACMGSGNCLYWAPEVFGLDDDGIAVVLGDPAGHEEGVRMAATNCPTAAIHVENVVHS
jgi:ferredoxin